MQQRLAPAISPRGRLTPLLRAGEDFTDPPHASNPSAGGFGYMETFTYPVPHPAPRARGQPAGQRWDGEKMITYKGWNWRCVVASGFGSPGVCLALRRGCFWQRRQA